MHRPVENVQYTKDVVISIQAYNYKGIIQGFRQA